MGPGYLDISILTDNANRAIQGNEMQVTQPGGQICYNCKCRHLMPNIGTNACVAPPNDIISNQFKWFGKQS